MTVNTTWTSPAGAVLDQTAGAVITETIWDAVVSNLYHVGGTAGFIGARAYNSANLSLANNTLTALTLNSERYDSDPNGAIHDTASLTERMTCRTDGKYLVVATVQFASNATGYRQVRIRKDGSTVLAEVTVAAVSGTVTTITCATVANLLANNYVEVLALQNSGGALNVEAQGEWSPEVSFIKV